MLGAVGFQIGSQEVFEGDGGNEDDDGGSVVIGGFGVEDFIDGFGDDVDAGDNDDDGNEDGGEALDATTVGRELVVAGEFLADDDKEARDGVDETMDGIGGDGQGTGEESDDDVKYAEEKIGGDEEIAGFGDDLAAGFGGFCGHYELILS